MKQVISLILFLSLFFIQLHSVIHVDGYLGHQHSCSICDLQSHQPSIKPSVLDFQWLAFFEPKSLASCQSKVFFLKIFILNNISPRAPPQLQLQVQLV